MGAKPTPEQVDAAIKLVVGRFDGTSGNCARFAAILNRVIGGAGEYALLDGGHYEYVDHVYLCHEGFLFDSEGMASREAVEAEVAEDREEDDNEALIDFLDPSEEGDDLRRLVDSSNPLAARWVDEDLEDALRQAFADMGFDPMADCRAPT